MTDVDQGERWPDPHREETRRAVDREVAARLRGRGIRVPNNERSEDIADLMSAVERFEAAVQARGGDLMVDDLRSSEPDDPTFVLPERGDGEAARAYIGRIDAATQALRSRPTRS